MAWEAQKVIDYGVADDPIIVAVPASLIKIMEYIEDKVDAEFAVYVPFRGPIRRRIAGIYATIYTIPRGYAAGLVIPPQEVTYSTIDVKEAPVGLAAIHRHPSGVKYWSSTDRGSICANNPLSLLYVDGEFVKATALIDNMIYDADAVLVFREKNPVPSILKGIERVDEQIENIKRKPVRITYPYGVRYPYGLTTDDDTLVEYDAYANTDWKNHLLD